MPVQSFPWKRNFAKLSPAIAKSVADIKTPLIAVAQTKTIPISDLADGLYKHVGLTVDSGRVVIDNASLPPASSGKWSRRNVQGWERLRRDLPKITKTYSWETPNFGDAATYGTHTTWRDREVYQVEFDEPRLHHIEAEILKSAEGNAPSVLVKFSVSTLIDKASAGFEKELLWALNVLQENTGVAGVYPSDAVWGDYLRTVKLDWEVFPPGTADEIIAVFRKRRRGKATKADAIMEERLKLFSSLKPTAYLAGTAKFSEYVGAQFAPDLVVFENARYGNALYVLYDDWKDISKRSRIDLVRGTSKTFDRFVHTDGWEDRFLELMRAEQEKRSDKKQK
jgi:hypothetical protein